MRWDELFADLEAQYDAVQDAELAAEVSDRTRRELALVRLIDRLRPAVGQRLTLRVSGVGGLDGQLIGLGPDWLLLGEIGSREALVSLSAVLSMSGLTAQSSSPGLEGKVAARLTLAFALRGIVRDRSPVTLSFIDGAITAGTLDRVGADFVEIAEHPPGELRRRDVVRTVRTVPLAAVAVVRRS
jgi:hypothetical protein